MNISDSNNVYIMSIFDCANKCCANLKCKNVY